MLFFPVLATLMVPVAAVLAPTYLPFGRLAPGPSSGSDHRARHLWRADPARWRVAPRSVHVRQFIETLPAGLYEAAKLDGASDWRILRKIVLPLIKPALVVLGIFVFMITWAQFLWPLVATTGDDIAC